MGAPTAQEQYFLELVNRARLDPLGEAARYGIDLNQGLAAGTITATQKQPLAFNFLLNDSADAHSNWMLAADVFSHTGVSGSSPMQRMQAAGYSFTGSWWNGENIAYTGTTGSITVDGSVGSLHRNLFLSAGHRENILNGAFKEAGIGAQLGVFTSGGVNWNAVMATENFATSGSNKFVSGVVYNDTDHDGFYSIGEGQGGITATLSAGATVLSQGQNWSAGGYIAATVSVGAVKLAFSGAGLASDIGVQFTMGTGNTKIDLVDSSTIRASASVYMLSGVANLELIGINAADAYANALANSVSGNAGNNALFGLAGADVLSGNDGNDWLSGGLGADTINGGNGNDYAAYNAAASAIYVNLASGLGSLGESAGDTLAGIENVWGSQFDDFVFGTNQVNWLIGDAGNDIISGGAGADYINGGPGYDWAYYAYAAEAVTISLAAGAGSAGEAAGDILVDMEYLWGSQLGDWLEGSSAANVIVGDAGNDIMSGGAGADYINGGAGYDWAYYAYAAEAVTISLAAGAGSAGEAAGDILVDMEYLWGSQLGDWLEGSSAANVIVGDAGNDVLIGGAEADVLDGGVGYDWAYYANAAGAVLANLNIGKGTVGDAAGDSLVGVEYIWGSHYSDTLIGSAIGNVLAGDAGNDFLQGLGGGDHLDGGAGSDWAYYAGASSAISANISLGQGSLGDAAGDAYVSIENLWGSNFNDTLAGDNSANMLVGGGGDDVLTGGAGGDAFYFDSGTNGNDRVTDFQDSVDRVYMEGVGGMAGLTITGNGTNDVTLAYAGGTITLHGSSLITLGVDDFIFA